MRSPCAPSTRGLRRPYRVKVGDVLDVTTAAIASRTYRETSLAGGDVLAAVGRQIFVVVGSSRDVAAPSLTMVSALTSVKVPVRRKANPVVAIQAIARLLLVADRAISLEAGSLRLRPTQEGAAHAALTFPEVEVQASDVATGEPFIGSEIAVGAIPRPARDAETDVVVPPAEAQTRPVPLR